MSRSIVSHRMMAANGKTRKDASFNQGLSENRDIMSWMTTWNFVSISAVGLDAASLQDLFATCFCAGTNCLLEGIKDAVQIACKYFLHVCVINLTFPRENNNVRFIFTWAQVTLSQWNMTFDRQYAFISSRKCRQFEILHLHAKRRHPY